MPAIVSGTVVRWELVAKATKDEFAKYVSEREVSVYVRDDAEDTDASAIISQYIIDAATNKKPEDPIELLTLARDGLLRVVGITRAPITPPLTR
jgi:hypothetical protein